MPSPVAHAFAGAAVYAGLTPRGAPLRDWRPWALVAFAGIAADLDFLPGLLLGHPGQYHHGPTHSIVAALTFAVLVAPLASPGLGTLGRCVAILGVAYGSHLALDFVTVHQPVRPGIPLFWPFSDALVLSPVVLFTDIHHGASWNAFVNWHNVGAVVGEALLVGVPVVAFCALRVRRPANAAADAG